MSWSDLASFKSNVPKSVCISRKSHSTRCGAAVRELFIALSLWRDWAPPPQTSAANCVCGKWREKDRSFILAALWRRYVCGNAHRLQKNKPLLSPAYSNKSCCCRLEAGEAGKAGKQSKNTDFVVFQHHIQKVWKSLGVFFSTCCQMPKVTCCGSVFNHSHLG